MPCDCGVEHGVHEGRVLHRAQAFPLRTTGTALRSPTAPPRSAPAVSAGALPAADGVASGSSGVGLSAGGARSGRSHLEVPHSRGADAMRRGLRSVEGFVAEGLQRGSLARPSTADKHNLQCPRLLHAFGQRLAELPLRALAPRQDLVRDAGGGGDGGSRLLGAAAPCQSCSLQNEPSVSKTSASLICSARVPTRAGPACGLGRRRRRSTRRPRGGRRLAGQRRRRQHHTSFQHRAVALRSRDRRKLNCATGGRESRRSWRERG
mmetsp:Transcript_136262/g.435958  ORF Transcript_136262/g.435958 Transcript_136262/m.435958 type:complete len:264 (+) Transcript_136262:5279-6070(+)